LVDHLGKEELHHFTAAGGLVTAAVAAAGGVCACACACACRGSAEKFEAGMAWPTLLVARGLQLWLAAVACSLSLRGHSPERVGSGFGHGEMGFVRRAA